ncbi:hypothetical protein GQ600_18968 [Phytophthora cactorum]|nr:hypothetical protein GQ600_18968 [Phytophthora cactorum]
MYRGRIFVSCETFNDLKNDEVRKFAPLMMPKDEDEELAASEEAFDASEMMLSPCLTAGKYKKEAKQLLVDEQLDRVMVHYQREVAKATTAQVVMMQKQVEVAQKRCADGKAATGSE